MQRGSAGIVIELDVREKARLARWETAVKERLQDASRFGVPSWIVAKHCKKEPGTDAFYREFTSQAEKLRGEYGLLPVGAGAREEYLTEGYVPTGPDYERLLAAQNGNVPKKTVGTSNVPVKSVPISENVPVCPECSKRPLPVSRTMCDACRMKLQRREGKRDE